MAADTYSVAPDVSSGMLISQSESPMGQRDSPAWVTAELPPAYAELTAQISALREQAAQYERMAGLLWTTGPGLTVAVRELFVALGYDVVAGGDDNGQSLDVVIDAGRRLLVQVAVTDAPIERQSPSITALLHRLQASAGDQDRLVLAVNPEALLPVDARRQEPVVPDALRLLQRLGVNVVSTPTLFGLWKYSLSDPEAARKSVIRLHGQDGGLFR